MPTQYRHYMKEWRGRRGMTQEQVAKALGTHRGMVSRYENSERGLTLAVQFKVMRILDVTPAQFFQDPDTESADALLQNATPESRKAILAMIAMLLADKA